MKIDTDGNNFLFDIRGNYQSIVNINKDEFFLQTDNYKIREYITITKCYNQDYSMSFDIQVGKAEKGHIIYTAPNFNKKSENVTTEEHTSITLYESKKIDGIMWYKINTEQWIPALSFESIEVNDEGIGTGITYLNQIIYSDSDYNSIKVGFTKDSHVAGVNI